MQPPPSYTFLRAHTVHVEPGLVRMRFSTHESMLGPQGSVQSGVLAAMADACIDAAVRSIADGRAPVTLELKANFLSATVPGEDLMCEAQVLRYGDSTAYVEATLSAPGARDGVPALPRVGSPDVLPASTGDKADAPRPLVRATSSAIASRPASLAPGEGGERMVARVSATCLVMV